MTTYWLSFRIAKHGTAAATYEARYDAFHVALEAVIDDPHYWSQTTSFAIFNSNLDIRPIAQSLLVPLLHDFDHFLIRKMDAKSALLFGVNENREIWNLMPYLARIS